MKRILSVLTALCLPTAVMMLARVGPAPGQSDAVRAAEAAQKAPDAGAPTEPISAGPRPATVAQRPSPPAAAPKRRAKPKRRKAKVKAKARPRPAPGQPPRTGLVGALNLNTAHPKLLRLLPGLGPWRAEAVVRRRLKRPFASTAELMEVSGIGPISYRRWQPHLKVRGENTLVRLEAPRGADK